MIVLYKTHHNIRKHMLFRAPAPSIRRAHVIQYSRKFSLNTLFLVLLLVVLVVVLLKNTRKMNEVIDLTSDFSEDSFPDTLSCR